MDIESAIELYDHDRATVARVVSRLQAHVGTRREKQAFLREVAERFAEAGYLVDIELTTTDGGGDDVTFYPTVTIAGRVDIEPDYDHDRQRHEVRAKDLAEAGPVAMPGAGTLWTPKGRG